ncbi:MAG: proton-conducting transporter membrane subunit [Microcella pacifica]
MFSLGSPLDPRALLAAASTPPLDGALWRLDGVTFALLVLVVGIAAAVLPFAHRSLRGDRHGTAITVALGAMLATTAWLALAGPLWMLGLAWSASTVATLVALGLGGGVRALLPGALWLIAADVALWAAVVLSSLGAGTDAAALLLVVAAALRCALPPAQSWLVGSLYAPTPVSAALHGGIVNGGGILVITQLPLISDSLLATVALALLAGFGLLVGVAASLTRTDIKGRLVLSTVAQMGFMLLCAALGLAAAALVHLVAHGLYKSSLFLSSSDGIDQRAYERRAPARLALSPRGAVARVATGAALPVLALAAVASRGLSGRSRSARAAASRRRRRSLRRRGLPRGAARPEHRPRRRIERPARRGCSRVRPRRLTALGGRRAVADHGGPARRRRHRRAHSRPRRRARRGAPMVPAQSRGPDAAGLRAWSR